MDVLMDAYGTGYWLVMASNKEPKTSECFTLNINSSNIHKSSKVIGSLLLRNPAAMHVLSANQLESEWDH